MSGVSRLEHLQSGGPIQCVDAITSKEEALCKVNKGYFLVSMRVKKGKFDPPAHIVSHKSDFFSDKEYWAKFQPSALQYMFELSPDGDICVRYKCGTLGGTNVSNFLRSSYEGYSWRRVTKQKHVLSMVREQFSFLGLSSGVIKTLSQGKDSVGVMYEATPVVKQVKQNKTKVTDPYATLDTLKLIEYPIDTVDSIEHVWL